MTAICDIPDCSKPSRTRGLCSAHYSRLLRHGDPRVTLRESPRPGRGCSVAGCGNPHGSKGLCALHYARRARTGDPLGVRAGPRQHELPCSVDGCEKPRRARGWCGNHWKSWKNYGDPLARKHRLPGEGTINYLGYKLIRMPGHPNANVNGYVHESRLVMSEIIGRPLLPDENVHHINGQRADNRPENLELWVTMQPSGQRPRDLVAWAREILARYGDLPEDV